MNKPSSASPLLNYAESPLRIIDNHASLSTTIPKIITTRLFLSHFLSTWNSRAFEFGAVLFLAVIFPETLLPMSVYALVRGASAILLSSAVGRYIDNGERLAVVRFSIVVQRLAVATSCIIFWILAIGEQMRSEVKVPLFVILALLGCFEKLCSIMNMVSVERDWVVVIAGKNEAGLQVLNSKMRRIDLFCKLAGPLAIGFLDGFSTKIAIIVTFSLNILSVPVEYFAIEKVYKTVPELERSQPTSATNIEPVLEETASPPPGDSNYASVSLLHRLNAYSRHPAFLPSISACLLYFTVLSFSGQMITYLLFVGYSTTHIAIARSVSVIFEISATWIAPRVMRKIGPIRAGLWFLNWQLAFVAVAAASFWGVERPFVAASGLVGGVILSRIGLWGFDQATQFIIQEEVEADRRGSFASLEAAFQNVFELCSYASTIIFSHPDQFQWPVLMSFIAVSTAGGLYAVFVRTRRGHLLHFSHCIERKERPGRHQRLNGVEGRMARSGIV